MQKLIQFNPLIINTQTIIQVIYSKSIFADLLMKVCSYPQLRHHLNQPFLDLSQSFQRMYTS